MTWLFTIFTRMGVRKSLIGLLVTVILCLLGWSILSGRLDKWINMIQHSREVSSLNRKIDQIKDNDRLREAHTILAIEEKAKIRKRYESLSERPDPDYSDIGNPDINSVPAGRDAWLLCASYYSDVRTACGTDPANP